MMPEGLGCGKQEEDRIEVRKIRIRTAQIIELEGDKELKDMILKSQELDAEVKEAIQIIKDNGLQNLKKGMQEWNYEDSLILFRGKIYVLKDEELRRKIVKSHHDPVIMGHPGCYKTTELVQHNYWWPGMTVFIKDYVKGCAICQETKNITHPVQMPLQPTEIPSRPFEYITTDFITKLPLSRGYDSILVITDQLTKTIVTILCNETIDADGTADLLIKNVFVTYGIATKIISDRGPQFASRVMKAVMKAMGIRSALSTAYHPQTDGATEITNQEIEQFLRAYCNRLQDNWADLLPYAAWTHNTRIHSATRKTPFELLFGITPHWPHQIKHRIEIPAAEE
jgi:hypothetical protein